MNTLKEKIKKVLGPRRMSTKRIMNKIIAKYPGYLIRKTCMYNNGRRALDQIRAEIASMILRDSDFSTDRDSSPHLHYLSK